MPNTGPERRGQLAKRHGRPVFTPRMEVCSGRHLSLAKIVRTETIMTTQKKTEANRMNALQSTGPRTDQGKALASGNAIKHGYYAGRVLPGEDKEKFQRLLEDLHREWHVRGSLEMFYLVLMARDIWRL